MDTLKSNQEKTISGWKRLRVTSYEREHKQRALLAKAVASNRRSVELSKELYTAGLSDFLSVLEAQNALYISENQ
jgi:outer membrane protein TolC